MGIANVHESNTLGGEEPDRQHRLGKSVDPIPRSSRKEGETVHFGEQNSQTGAVSPAAIHLASAAQAAPFPSTHTRTRVLHVRP